MLFSLDKLALLFTIGYCVMIKECHGSSTPFKTLVLITLSMTKYVIEM